MDEQDLALYAAEAKTWNRHMLVKEMKRLRSVSNKWEALYTRHGIGVCQVRDAERMLRICKSLHYQMWKGKIPCLTTLTKPNGRS